MFSGLFTLFAGFMLIQTMKFDKKSKSKIYNNKIINNKKINLENDSLNESLDYKYNTLECSEELSRTEPVNTVIN